jgi:pimeloyl-ACP methyl ester carboxylesterase
MSDPLAAAPPPRWRRRLARPALFGLGLAALLCAAGAAYEAVGAARDARRFPTPGRLVDVGGGRRHLHCTGQGSPTVVLEAGLGSPGLTWALVQPEVARRTRVCSYDRGGYGYSDPVGREPRTAAQVALELRALLERGGERGPYVLVGHSFGGLVARVLAAQSPGDVAGLVLVDASHEDARARLPDEPPPEHLGRMLRRGRGIAPLGVLRLRPGLAGWDPRWAGFRRLPPETLRAMTWLALQRKTLAAAAAEVDAFETSGAQARAAGTLGDRPLVVLAAARRRPDLDHLSADAAARYWRVWVEELQPALARLSARGVLRPLPDSGHSIHLERPDAVIAAVDDIVAEVRGRVGASQPRPQPPRPARAR